MGKCLSFRWVTAIQEVSLACYVQASRPLSKFLFCFFEGKRAASNRLQNGHRIS